VKIITPLILLLALCIIVCSCTPEKHGALVSKSNESRIDARLRFVSPEILRAAIENKQCIWIASSKNIIVNYSKVGEGMRAQELLAQVAISIQDSWLRIIKSHALFVRPSVVRRWNLADEKFLNVVITPGDVLKIGSRD